MSDAKYCIDSDVLIWHLRTGDRQRAVEQHLVRLAASGSLSCSMLSVAEVEQGVRRGEEDKTRGFLPEATEIRQVARDQHTDAMVSIVDAAQLYERLVGPSLRLERWSVKPRRPVGDAELRATAWGLIAAFEELVATPSLDLEVTVREARADEPPPEEDFSGVNTLLESLRRTRGLLVGSHGDLFRHALRAREPEASKVYEEALGRALVCFQEIEKLLVLYGAGTDEDAALAGGVIPTPRQDLPAGHGVPFDL